MPVRKRRFRGRERKRQEIQERETKVRPKGERGSFP